MSTHRLRIGVAKLVTAGSAALFATLILGGGSASATPPPDPAGGANPVPPHFFNGNVEQIRGTGSDTTIFMMQRISDLYTGAGLYGCTLDSAAAQPLYNTAADDSPVTTLTSALTNGTPVTSLSVVATTFALPS